MRRRSRGRQSRVASNKRASSSNRKSNFKFEVETTVARDVKAVIYFVLAVALVLSLQGRFGIIGDGINAVFRPILGWGIYAMPVLLGLASFMLFLSKKMQLGFSRLFGVSLIMLSVLSIFHLSVGVDDIFIVGKNGEYGGLIGFVTNFLFREVLQIGHFGSSIVFISICLIGVLFAFSIPLAQILALFKPEINVRSVNEKEDHEYNEKSDPEIFIRKTPISEIKQEEIEEDVIKMNEDEDMDVEVELEEDDIKIIDGRSQGSIKGDAPEKEEVPFEWKFPTLDLLAPPAKAINSDEHVLKDNAEKIRRKLEQFNIEVTMHEIHVGPTVVQYTLRPHEGVKLSKIIGLKDDLALALAAKSVRIEAPIPGKSLVGIEVPNDKRTTVHLKEVLESKEFQDIDSALRIPFGRDVAGKAIIEDLGSMPHLLIAGTTGSGKSVGINTLILSLIYQNTPKDLRLIMVDPKRVELTSYNNLPYLLAPIITEAEKAVIALRWVVAEMNRRYVLFQQTKHRNILDHNKDPNTKERMPRIVIIIDELAELMMAAKNEVEAYICRIAQLARAVGIHLVVATQRPSVDVVTGLIKANIPARVAFAVRAAVDSKTILDTVGAEDLLGKGDMLYLAPGMDRPFRVQGIYVSSKEIEDVTNFVKLNNQMEPQYDDSVTAQELADEKISGLPESHFASEDESGELNDEDLYKVALKVIVEHKKASASLLQRRMKLGYARAARILDELEECGFIGPVQGAKPRDIYFDRINQAESVQKELD
ncbi:MAG: cell division protein ftsK, DNA segregation ATPase FtsK/SpoIIIE, S-DNA-T family [Candidatus Peregrinibacteria bacterium GW2011_GWF2_38_29]|nr:MAG: cell division protein ftsK, DNA segregation ATPase FtsK/SpoIIIE, S-DNA-T family [Candidatus Peregrinibacteria bacterium GW2011_GWF2_38_29]HBB02814.1 cell division protein FtsK [Candidatus Peregrinibacteria bacterium]